MDYYDEVETQAGVPAEDVNLWNLKRKVNVVKKATRFLKIILGGKVCITEMIISSCLFSHGGFENYSSRIKQFKR